MCYGLLVNLLPGVVATDRYAQYMAKQAHRMSLPLRFDKVVAAHRVSVTEKMATAFF